MKIISRFNLSAIVFLLVTLCMSQNLYSQSGDEVPDPHSNDNAEQVHVIDASPVGVLFGTNVFGYIFIKNKNAFGVFGGPSFSYSSAADLSGYLAGIYYARHLDLFKNDPGFFGTALSYSHSEGSLDVGTDTPYKTGLDATVASISLFYGHSYKWNNGFTMSWRVGGAIPFIWKYDWENTSGKSAETFKDDTDLFEVISKVISIVLGGSGWNMGWSF